MVAFKKLVMSECNTHIKCTFVGVFTGKEFTHIFSCEKVTRQNIIDWAEGRKHIQYAMPNLTAEEREMFLFGDCFPDETKH
jgi:hypothetical protein